MEVSVLEFRANQGGADSEAQTVERKEEPEMERVLGTAGGRQLTPVPLCGRVGTGSWFISTFRGAFSPLRPFSDRDREGFCVCTAPEERVSALASLPPAAASQLPLPAALPFPTLLPAAFTLE